MKRLAFLCLILAVSISAVAQPPAGFTKIGTSASTSYTDSTCPDGAKCYYYVTAVNSSGEESAVSNEAAGAIPTTGAHTVSLNWTASTTTGVTYNVYQQIGPFAPSGLTATVN